jgi:hypothetical protein
MNRIERRWLENRIAVYGQKILINLIPPEGSGNESDLCYRHVAWLEGSTGLMPSVSYQLLEMARHHALVTMGQVTTFHHIKLQSWLASKTFCETDSKQSRRARLFRSQTFLKTKVV